MRCLIIIFTICYAFQLKAQKSLLIKKATSEITIDGELNELDWLTADKARNFQQSYPADTIIAQTQTEVMVTFDKDNLYIAAICYDSLPDKQYTVQSLKRDFNNGISDNFSIHLDPFNDNVNGFSFSVNPLGVQREGLIEGGGNFGASTDWDNKWFVEVKRHPDKWIVEMKIPFKTIRYNHDLSTWGINFSRNDLKRNEKSVWNPVPRQYDAASLAFTGKLNWDEKAEKAGTNISIIPYLIGSSLNDFENDVDDVDGNVGFDAKVAVTSSLNLDITVNPDFSQVEVDQQVTNLSRFSLFFPERRQFFIENSDLFSQFGFRQIRPFFSRRIGLNNGNIIPIIGGARLSGKLNKNWRIGIMNMQTEGFGGTVDRDPVKPQNYTVTALQRRVGKRSSLDAIFVNRQGFNDKNIDYSDYNRIVGADFNLRSDNNKWQGRAFYHRAYTPNLKDKKFTHATWLMHNSEKITAHWNYEFVGKNYRTDVGFVPRISQFNTETGEVVYASYWRFEPSFDYRFYPKSSVVQNYQIGTHWSEYLNDDFESTERQVDANFTVSFVNQSRFSLRAFNNEVLLSFPTDITFSGNNPIDSGRYKYNNIAANYNSSTFKIFNYSLSADYGDYFIGEKLTTSASINYRAQPWGIFGVNINQNKIFMPDGFDDASLWLIGPKLEFSFTKKVFFTTFIQYNTQIDNVNINARFQYRFKPMSDLFIVYTDNYNSPNLSIKNRALVIKLVYWINV